MVYRVQQGTVFEFFFFFFFLFFVLIAIRYKSQQSPYDASNERKLFQSLHNNMPQ
jgi:hypothetical protein